MRFHTFASISTLAAVFGALAACANTVETSGNGASSSTGGGSTASSSGGTGNTSTTSTSTSTSASSSGTVSSSSGTVSSSSGAPPPTCSVPGVTGPCLPTASCVGISTPCLAHIVPGFASTDFTLRLAQLTFTAPDAFAKGIVGTVIAGGIAPSDVPCNIAGSGQISWLLRFDTVAGTITTGGSKPVMNPGGPYHFVDEVISNGGAQVKITPATTALTQPDACSFASSPVDVIVPFYLDGAGTQLIPMPLRAVRFHDAAISPDHACVGHYNADGLLPENSCLADGVNPTFVDGGALDALITLEDADSINVTPLQQSLCTLLTGNPAAWGQKGPDGVTRCKRDAGNHITFPGDWCASTNSSAHSGCEDAMRVSGTFSAQAVKLQ